METLEKRLERDLAGVSVLGFMPETPITEAAAGRRLNDIREKLRSHDGLVTVPASWRVRIGGPGGLRLIDYIQTQLGPAEFSRLVFTPYLS